MDIAQFESRQGQEVFLFSQTSKLVLGFTQPPIQWVYQDPVLGFKCLGCEVDHPLPSGAEGL